MKRIIVLGMIFCAYYNEALCAQGLDHIQRDNEIIENIFNSPLGWNLALSNIIKLTRSETLEIIREHVRSNEAFESPITVLRENTVERISYGTKISDLLSNLNFESGQEIFVDMFEEDQPRMYTGLPQLTINFMKDLSWTS